ncbi:hypothetical protein [Mesorhizobium sp.]|uniref:hypothetical protein n=1 Tax=Mesorhizobium sp. TaxID=1871066 RepID=UPI000FE33A1A|nr:hypothetical protein [Mesorhizobium sp.]RWP27958.1 MAG: hypothetical protein EOR02_21155 [Mesorhizobium sp.]RWP69444.1 MAG: hypothetical protein EOR07_02625 [Mesorhizobium sp.]RWQ14439.1 MAG: hypothetical protein EOR92_26860 [Mesorhizobium sp.]
MILVLWAAVIGAIVVCYTNFPAVSVPWIGVVGLFSYTIPALVGLTSPVMPTGMAAHFAPASAHATSVMAIVWISFAASIAIANSVGVIVRNPIRVVPHPRYVSRFLTLIFLLSAGIFASYVARQGTGWFLQSRSELGSAIGVDWLIWKWSNALGLIVAAYFFSWSRLSKVYAAYFATMIVINMIAGDRTTPVIAVIGAIFSVSWGMPISRAVLSPKAWLSGGVVLAIIFLAKPFYVAMKTGQSFGYVFDSMSTMAFQSGWEAFATHELLERVTALGVSYSPWATLRDSLAQFLVMPSAFGFDSTGYNELIQTQIVSYATYGLASNFWAHWWSMFGLVGAVAGGMVYGFSLIFLNNKILRSQGTGFFLFMMLAAILGVYVHRNSPENILALMRPIVLAYGVVWLAMHVIPLRAQYRGMQPMPNRNDGFRGIVSSRSF